MNPLSQSHGYKRLSKVRHLCNTAMFWCALAKPAPVKVAAPTPIRKTKTRPVAPKPAEKLATGGTKNVRSTMEGTILDILVKEGDTVERGTKLLILEAMKMQNQVLSPVSGSVAKIMVKVGETVKDGQNLITLAI